MAGRMQNIEGVMDTIVGTLGPPSPPRVVSETCLRHEGEGRRAQLDKETNCDAELARAHHVAAAVLDPEIPVLTLEDLGVLRGVERRGGRIVVKLTPTYTGCPATLAIQLAVEAALAEAGMPDARVETVLSPPWSTDQISEARPPQAERVRHSPAQSGLRPACPVRRGNSGVPEVRLGGDRQDLRVRLDRLQSALALQDVRRTLRLLQVHLIHAARFPCRYDCRGEARDAGCYFRGIRHSRNATRSVPLPGGATPDVAHAARRRRGAAQLLDLLGTRRRLAHRHQACRGRILLDLGQHGARGGHRFSMSCRPRAASSCRKATAAPGMLSPLPRAPASRPSSRW